MTRSIRPDDSQSDSLARTVAYYWHKLWNKTAVIESELQEMERDINALDDETAVASVHNKINSLE